MFRFGTSQPVRGATCRSTCGRSRQQTQRLFCASGTTGRWDATSGGAVEAAGLGASGSDHEAPTSRYAMAARKERSDTLSDLRPTVVALGGKLSALSRQVPVHGSRDCAAAHQQPDRREACRALRCVDVGRPISPLPPCLDGGGTIDHRGGGGFVVASGASCWARSTCRPSCLGMQPSNGSPTIARCTSWCCLAATPSPTWRGRARCRSAAF